MSIHKKNIIAITNDEVHKKLKLFAIRNNFKRLDQAIEYAVDKANANDLTLKDYFLHFDGITEENVDDFVEYFKNVSDDHIHLCIENFMNEKNLDF